MPDREVVITGIGLLTSLGSTLDEHRTALRTGTPRIDSDLLAPYPVHPLCEVDWSEQIGRRDMRQMEPWQRIGTFAAGLALDDAGVKGDEDIVARMDMIVAAGGGERDIEVDSAILDEAPSADGYTGTAREEFVAERLSNDLRPTLFLAQLSNLLAGNISIVHKVTGSSRTFMGEEGAGMSAIATAQRKIAAGQSDIVLVGGSFSASRKDMALVFELGGYLLQGDWLPVDAREHGLVLGSVGCFLVMESREHADARDARSRAVLASVDVSQTAADRRDETLKTMTPDADLVLVGSPSGRSAQAAPVRHYGSLTGHGVEAQFPLGIALAALTVESGEAPVPLSEAERPADGSIASVAVAAVGHWRGEAAALVVPA